jgi:hypothetical protein
MGGMSEIRTSADPFRDTPEQGCFTIAATIAFMIIMLPVMGIVNLYHKYDESCGARAARPQNFVAIVISEHNDAVRGKLSALCEGHVEGPIITVDEGGRFDAESFYNVDQNFPWKSDLPRPRYVRYSGEYGPFFIYAIFIQPDALQKARDWWSEHGYGSGGVGKSRPVGRYEEEWVGSQAYEYIYGKSRGRLYLVSLDGEEPIYLLKNAVKQTDRRQLKGIVQAYRKIGE